MKEGWEYKKLDDICYSVEDGDWIESKDQSPNGIRLIQTGNIGNGVYKDKQDSAKYISEETFKRLNCTEIFEGDILVSRLPDPVGRACILPDLGCRCITAVDCSIIRLKKDIVCNAWISYYMQSLAYFSIIKAQCTGSTRLRITRKKLAEILIPLPSLSEQQSIVDYLDSAFAKIDAMKANAEKSLNEAKALFQASLKEMLEPKEGWEENRLSDIVDVNCPISYGIVQQGEHIEGGVPVVRPVDLNRKYITANQLKCTTQTISSSYKRTILRGDEILLGVRGTTGIVGLATEDLSGCNVNRGIVPLFFKDGICRDFIYYMMLSPSMQSVFKEKTTGSTLKQINIKDLRMICFSYPPLSEQQSIVATLDSLKSKVDRLQANFEKISQECDALKQALLREVFEG